MKTNLLNAMALAIVMTTCYNCSVEPLDDLQTESLSTENFTAAQIPANAANSEAPTDAEETANPTCDGTNSRIRIVNNGSFTAHYKIYTADVVLLGEVDNLLPETVSEWIEFPEGTVIINVTIDSLSDQKVSYNMVACTELTMEIDVNNQLTNAEPGAITN